MFTRGAAPCPRRVCQWWTGGKDTVWALHVLRNDPDWDVRGLLARVDSGTCRSVVHGLRKELLEQQAAAVGLPLRLVEFDSKGPSSEYEAALQRGLSELREEGAEFVSFGELASSGYMERRSGLIAASGLTAEFPLWGRDPHEHVRSMLDAGVIAWVCAVNTMALAPDQAGRRFDAEFVAELPAHADPGGGNEFHTFVEWAPGWSRRVSVKPGRLIEEYHVAFVDLEPVLPGAPAATPRSPATAPAKSHEAATAPGVDPFQYYERLKRVRAYVEEHPGERLTIDTVAKVAAMRTSSFGRYFRQRVGVPFGLWLTRRRVDRACLLLRQSDTPVRRVGKLVGFGAARTFRRAFQLHVGCSPSQYRKRCLAEEARRSAGS